MRGRLSGGVQIAELTEPPHSDNNLQRNFARNRSNRAELILGARPFGSTMVPSLVPM